MNQKEAATKAVKTIIINGAHLDVLHTAAQNGHVISSATVLDLIMHISTLIDVLRTCELALKGACDGNKIGWLQDTALADTRRILRAIEERA